MAPKGRRRFRLDFRLKLSVSNRTDYRFDRPVHLEPHVIRLRPRLDATVWPIAVELNIAPAPVVRSEHLDVVGNAVTRVWFEGKHDHLTIDSRFEVETSATDPFRFLLDHPERRLPSPYPEGMTERLHAYLKTPESAAQSVRALGEEIATEVDNRPERFPMALAAWIHGHSTIEVRHQGSPNPAEVTLSEKRGACRDLAVLFNECCREMGLAARFVSGYLHIDESDAHDLHAWAEVYLPGGGWRGYDPTHGLAVADQHVAVAAAAEPEDAAPVHGSYRGSAKATLSTTVHVAGAD